MDRKQFLKTMLAGAAAPVLSSCADNGGGELPKSKYILWKRINLKVGLEKPARIVHISDTHFCFADARDDRRKRDLAKQRERIFCGKNMPPDKSPLTRNLYEAIDYANKSGALVVYTGDLIDFTSKLNFELGRRALARCDNYIMAVGNHDFCQYIGDSPEDEAYKARSAAEVRKMAGHDIAFASRVFGGVNVVSIDNNYYRFTEDAAAKLEREVAKGLPIVLAMHIPLYTKEFYEYAMSSTRGGCALLIDVPGALLAAYTNEARRIEQTPDKPTKEFVKYLKAQPLVKAVLCGHFHSEVSDRLFGDTMQYCVGATGRNLAQEFVIT